jgi:hypothetical protein
VIATSNESDSSPVRLEVAWDGQWHDGETEMGRNLTIRRFKAAISHAKNLEPVGRKFGVAGGVLNVLDGRNLVAPHGRVIFRCHFAVSRLTNAF